MSNPAYNYATPLVTETCCHSNCGITFAVPSEWHKKKHADHSWFYCPNGHQQHYLGKSPEEKLREELDQEKRRREMEVNRRRAAERQTSAARGQVTKIKNRIKNGVCPFCNRTFKDVQRHMASKHAECER